MSKTIWKWTLELTDRQQIALPRSAEILTVQMQGGLPQIWALCDPVEEKVPRDIAIIGTGHPAPDETGRYIGTFQVHGGSLIFHVFERTS